MIKKYISINTSHKQKDQKEYQLQIQQHNLTSRNNNTNGILSNNTILNHNNNISSKRQNKNQLSKDINQNNSNVQKALLKKKLNQNVSCLYSDHLYKKNQVNLIEKMHIQKYKHLYQKQKRERFGLIKQIQNLNNKIKFLEEQKQTLNFAYKTLEIKKMKEEQIQKKKKRRSILEKAARNSIKYQNILMQQTQKLKVTEQNHKSRLSSFAQLQQDNQVSKIQIIETKNDNQTLKNQQPRLKSIQNSESSNDEQQDKFQDHMEELIKQKDEKILQLQAKIQQKQNQNYRLCQQVIRGLQVQQQLKQRNLQISEAQQKIQKLLAQIQYFKQQSKQNLQNFETLKKQIEEKQKKEQHQMKLLNKFSQQLKISDSKIKQFMVQQFGLDFTGCSNEKIAYKQKLSYLLHLSKKKESLYQASISDLKKHAKQVQFRCEILQRKNDQTIKIYERLVTLAAKGDLNSLVYFIQRSIK